MAFLNEVAQAAARQAHLLLAREPLFLDTETTGLGSWSEIVEIAIVDHRGEPLINTLIRPNKPIPADATRIHGITNRDVEGAPLWQEVWPRIAKMLAGRPVGIYNANFDLRMMAQSNRLARLPWREDGLDSFCVMQIYAQFYGMLKGRGYRWQSLAKAAVQCRINMPNAHRALADAQLARAVFLHMAGKAT